MAKADGLLGGQSGKAVDAIKGRQDRLQQEEDRAMGKESPKESPNRNPTGDSSTQRPPQSKKWYERILP
jgi:hypothetical protein